jgi:hypothetical protein
MVTNKNQTKETKVANADKLRKTIPTKKWKTSSRQKKKLNNCKIYHKLNRNQLIKEMLLVISYLIFWMGKMILVSHLINRSRSIRKFHSLKICWLTNLLRHKEQLLAISNTKIKCLGCRLWAPLTTWCSRSKEIQRFHRIWTR